MDKKPDNGWFASKISTGVPGLDDLFYGGLRLPGNNVSHGGVSIVIYGDRGISKSDLAMQIMRGVHDSITKSGSVFGDDLSQHYYSLNHRESELRKKYRGLEIAKRINAIKFPEAGNCKCDLCCFFPELQEQLGEALSLPNAEAGTCYQKQMERCQICKLIRHEVINYSDRSQTLHWTVGNVSDDTNLLAKLDLKSDKYGDDGVFDADEREEELQRGSYNSTAYNKFNQILDDIHTVINKRKDDKESAKFRWSSLVIEGFTAFSDEELQRLPYNDLILKLRSVAAVSILVFDQRGMDLHPNADIIIYMRKHYDASAQYIFHELHIVKSDLQQHVHGWQKYRKQRDLSVEIYPSMHSLLLRRFATSNAVLRLEQDNLRYPQSLLSRFQYQCALQKGKPADYGISLIQTLLNDKTDRSMVYDELNQRTKVDCIETSGIDALFHAVHQEIQGRNHTVVFFLLGESEQRLRKKLSIDHYTESELRNIHCWELSLGCIWAEEFVSIIKRYISSWKQRSTQKHLHIVVDDFANINLFPLMEKECLLIPALVTVCQNATMLRGYDDHARGIDIQLSLVCTSHESSQFRMIKQLSD